LKLRFLNAQALKLPLPHHACSITVSDWWSDLAGRQLQLEAAGVVGYAHEGTLAAALYMLERVKAVLTEAADQVPGWPVLVTGHSLGGEPFNAVY
jgi:hypothetical protein